MAEMLDIPYETAKVKLFRVGIKPKTKDAVYEKSALEVIRTARLKTKPKNNSGKICFFKKPLDKYTV
jgi:hypothetical protein